MSSKIFKISAVAATIAASFAANAALYQVYGYQPVVSSSSETYGAAIAPENAANDCWSTACSKTDYKIAFEEKRFQEGFLYRNEAPFLIENGFEYLEKDHTGFKDYCNAYLGYVDEICEDFADRQYTNGYGKEDNGDYQSSSAYLETTPVSISSNNTIINSITSTGDIVGSYQVDANTRTRAFYGSESAVTNQFTDGVRTRAWTRLNTENVTVGSVSFDSSSRVGIDYKSQAAIWEGTTLNLFNIAGSEDNRSMPQGSARDIARVNASDYYAVGYSANNEEIPVAAIFPLGNLSSLSGITPTLLSAYNDHDKYLNSLLTSVNKRGVAIGTVKFRQSIDGAYANRIFYVPDVTSPSVVEFNTKFSSMFFTSANALAGAINGNDEVVGQVDYESHRESGGGKPRAKRAFIAPLSGNNKAPISTAWYLDDLTYGSGASADNNKYRIFDATDINDAGVISGSAYYCSNGWDSEAINAKCSSGATIVAVKLVPISTGDRSITPRPVTQTTVERQGGTLGFLALGLLGVLGFRRK